MLISRNAAYAVRLAITVAEVSTTIRAIRSEVPLAVRDGMPRPCVIQTDNLATIPKALLETKILSLTSAKLAELDEALRYALGLDGASP